MNYIENMIKRYPELEICSDAVQKAVEMICSMHQSEGKLLLCGNGGSCADCGHIAGELMKGFLSLRTLPEEKQKHLCDAGIPPELTQKFQRGLCVLSLPEMSAVGSAFCNDVDAELVYAQLVYAAGNQRDVFMGISTSGNSANVVWAAKTAKAMGIPTIALTGATGGKLAGICDVTIKAPASETYQVQEYHLPIYHAICAEVERILF